MTDKKYESQKIKGDGVVIEWWELDDALRVRWRDNGKRHDIDALCASIVKYGFRDPVAYDHTLRAIVEGHGRIEALNKLYITGEEAPRGIKVKASTWFLPVLVGVDASTPVEAESYAIDHNNLVLGTDVNIGDILRLWEPEKLTPVMDRLYEQKQDALTLDNVSIQALLNAAGIPTEPNVRLVKKAEQETNQTVVQKYQVLVDCKDVEQQSELFARLNEEGYAVYLPH